MQSDYISDTVRKFFNVCAGLNDQNKWAVQNETFPSGTSESQFKNSVGHLIFVTWWVAIDSPV